MRKFSPIQETRLKKLGITERDPNLLSDDEVERNNSVLYLQLAAMPLASRGSVFEGIGKGARKNALNHQKS